MGVHKKFKIGYIIPGIGLSKEESKRRRTIANSIVHNSEVDIIGVDQGPMTIETCVEEAYASSSYLSKIYNLQRAYDAFIVGCFGDPGIRAARELIDKLVVGPAQASLNLASQLADDFVIVSPLEGTVILTKHIVKAYGFGEYVTSIVPAEIPVIDFIENREKASNKLTGIISTALKENGGGAVILGCMSMGYALVDELVKDSLKVPVINPVKASLITTESILNIGLKQSKTSYPNPNYSKLEHLLK
ncbi:MAG: aspartate/glutamate racemase family protein [Nitrososphaeria archaeon]